MYINVYYTMYINEAIYIIFNYNNFVKEHGYI